MNLQKKMPEIHAVIFDLDGTLMDSEVIYVEAVREALSDRSRPLSSEETIRLVYGRGWKDIYREVEHSYPGSYASIEEMEKVVREKFTGLRARRDIRILNSIALLERLADDYPVAIVSGSPREDIAAAISVMKIGPRLEFYLGAEDYFPGKPDPACYRLAAQKLEVPPEGCVVFEDSAAGVVAAKEAGMYCVALRRPNMPFQDVGRADLTLEDLANFQLEDLLR